jgi:beta-glucanase (GH16 family)
MFSGRAYRQHQTPRRIPDSRNQSHQPFFIEGLESRLLLSSVAAPADLLATNGSTPTAIQLTWNAVSGATSYEVWRSTTASTTSATDIAPSLSGTTFNDTVTVGTTYYYWVVAVSASTSSAFSTIATATGGTLVFDDTFGSDGLTSAWGSYVSQDPNNPEVNYTNTTAAEATSSNPATLQIVSDPNATNGQALAMSLTPSPSNNGTYDGAAIKTEFDPSGLGDDMEYGEIQARIKLPGGNNSAAIWPAFWMMGDNYSTVGWPQSGEIDVMEAKGSQPGTNYSTIHGPLPLSVDPEQNGYDASSSYTLPGGADFYSSYHTFAMNWGPNFVTFSVDGVPFETFTPANIPSDGTWVFNGHPFFLLLDITEGGSYAPGTITSTQTMDVDYVRAYSLPAPTGVAATIAKSGTPAQVVWTATPGATSYQVWRNNSDSTTDATLLTSNQTTTSFTDNSASVGTDYYYWIVATNAQQSSGFSNVASSSATSAIAGEYIFYSDSTWDGYDPGSADDLNAIAPDKSALLPGGTATYSNLTDYSNGINGIMIDALDLPSGSTLSASDFKFAIGDANNTTTWTTLATSPTITLLSGSNGITHVDLTWPNQTILNTWLQVTMLADSNTGLSSNAIFYFGNLVGETFNSGSPAQVTAEDLIDIQTNIVGSASITNPYDLNRDGAVDAQDLILAEKNSFSAINLIAPTGTGPATQVAAQSSATADVVAAVPVMTAATDDVVNTPDSSGGNSITDSPLNTDDLKSPYFRDHW